MRLFALLLVFVSTGALAKPRGKAPTKGAAGAAATPAPEPPPRGRMELQGSERVSGPLTDIEPTIRRQQPKLEACYEKQYAKDGRLQGVFALELTVAPNGRVKDLEPTKDSVKSEALSGCIMTIARRLQFPRANGKGDTIVRVVIDFIPAPPPPAPILPPAPVATSPASASAPGLRR